MLPPTSVYVLKPVPPQDFLRALLYILIEAHVGMSPLPINDQTRRRKQQGFLIITRVIYIGIRSGPWYQDQSWLRVYVSATIFLPLLLLLLLLLPLVTNPAFDGTWHPWPVPSSGQLHCCQHDLPSPLLCPIIHIIGVIVFILNIPHYRSIWGLCNFLNCYLHWTKTTTKNKTITDRWLF